MKKKFVLLASVLLTCLIAASPALADRSGLRVVRQITGERAYDHVAFLSETIGTRTAGSAEESMTAGYIAGQFEAMGYAVELQHFTVNPGTDNAVDSVNIIATKSGRSDRTVLVGAHYDSVPARVCEDIGETGTGAGDNASGVGVMLEVAEALARYKTRGTITFIAFGAEEIGLHGSRYYAAQMTSDEIEKTVAMINLDSVGVGDFFYVYAGLEDNPGWVRDKALQIGQRIGYDLRTSPGSEFFEYGTTGDWSDHVPFRQLGIPIAYFEWMNWDIEPNGGIETEEFGWILHTCRDNIGFVDIEKLELTADVVGALVLRISKIKHHRPRPMPKSMAARGMQQLRVQKRYPQAD